MVFLTRRETFSASHRLWNAGLTAAENEKLFGKCANGNGHGHNYVLEVTLAGEVDERTGMIMSIEDLRTVLEDRVIRWVDHKHLDHDVAWLDGTISTSEVLVQRIWERLAPELGGLLYEVAVRETENNAAFYRGEAG